MNIFGIQPGLNQHYSCTTRNQNNNYHLKNTAGDTVSFSGKPQTISFIEVRDILNNTEPKDWKQAKKGHTKISRIKEFKHPEYGKIKIGLSLDPALNGPLDKIYSPKAFVEVPKVNFKSITSNENSFIFEFVAKLIGRESVDELKNKGLTNEKQVLKKYHKTLEQANAGSNRKNKQINYIA